MTYKVQKETIFKYLSGLFAAATMISIVPEIAPFVLRGLGLMGLTRKHQLLTS